MAVPIQYQISVRYHPKNEYWMISSEISNDNAAIKVVNCIDSTLYEWVTVVPTTTKQVFHYTSQTPVVDYYSVFEK